MKRRDFIAIAAATVAFPRLALAQQARLPRVALASPTVSVPEMNDTSSDKTWRSFMIELRRLGLIEGQNVTLERYSTLGITDPEQMGRAIAATRPDVIFVGGHTAMAQAAARAAPDLPVVFLVGDALASGLVTNLARPGGNLTGVNTTAGVETEGKRIALIHEAVPRATRVGFLDTVTAYEPLGHRPVAEATAATRQLTLIPAIVDRPFDEAVFRTAFDALVRQGAQIVAIATATNINSNLGIVASLTKAAQLPACSADSSYIDFGGLMTYGADRLLSYARAASYVVQILNGARPGDLPVLQPEKFELIVNLKAAAELGLELPQSLLLQATDVRG